MNQIWKLKCVKNATLSEHLNSEQETMHILQALNKKQIHTLGFYTSFSIAHTSGAYHIH